MTLMFDKQTPAWYKLLCSVGKLCLDNLTHSSRKSSLPAEGGNVSDLQTFSTALNNRCLSDTLAYRTLLEPTPLIMYAMAYCYYFIAILITVELIINLNHWCKPHSTHDQLIEIMILQHEQVQTVHLWSMYCWSQMCSLMLVRGLFTQQYDHCIEVYSVPILQHVFNNPSIYLITWFSITGQSYQKFRECIFCM